MPAAQPKNYSTIEAIKSSIHTDTHVYRWFSFLILRDPVREKISKREEEADLYKKIDRTIKWQRTSAGAFLFFIVAGLIFKNIILLCLSALFVYPLVWLHIQKKKEVLSISQRLLEEDFEKESFGQRTLYAISEEYGRKYQIPSMVDYIYVSNKILRWAVLGGGVTGLLILPLKGWQNGMAIVLVYAAVYSFVNSRIIFKYINK